MSETTKFHPVIDQHERKKKIKKLLRTDEDIKIAVEAWCGKWEWDDNSGPKCTESGNSDEAEKQYGPISRWNVSKVKNMANLFQYNKDFNDDISRWDVRSVTNMFVMFGNAEKFNRDLNQWDVSSVTDMRHMFHGAKKFNLPLDRWDVSRVTNMRSMFYEANSFNQDLSQWDVSSVTNMRSMFYEANSFNQDLSQWDVRSVTDMREMFDNSSMKSDPEWYNVPKQQTLEPQSPVSQQSVISRSTVGQQQTQEPQSPLSSRDTLESKQEEFRNQIKNIIGSSESNLKNLKELYEHTKNLLKKGKDLYINDLSKNIHNDDINVEEKFIETSTLNNYTKLNFFQIFNDLPIKTQCKFILSDSEADITKILYPNSENTYEPHYKLNDNFEFEFKYKDAFKEMIMNKLSEYFFLKPESDLTNIRDNIYKYIKNKLNPVDEFMVWFNYYINEIDDDKPLKDMYPQLEELNCNLSDFDSIYYSLLVNSNKEVNLLRQINAAYDDDF